MTGKSPEVGAPPQKRTRTATVSYTYHSLEAAIKLADAIRQIGNGRQAVSRSLIASHLGVDEQSGDFGQRMASAKTFGLIEGKTDAKLTDDGRSYFFPTGDPAVMKKAALLKFLSSPGAYRALIERYDGSRPTVETMANVLGETYGIPESWKTRVAQFFVKSGIFAGAIDSHGFIRYKAQVESLVSGRPASEPDGNGVEPPKPEPPKPPVAAEEPDGTSVIIWKYPFQGKMLRVETPEDITLEIWEKLNKYIQVLKP